jgi:hypothetical protein
MILGHYSVRWLTASFVTGGSDVLRHSIEGSTVRRYLVTKVMRLRVFIVFAFAYFVKHPFNFNVEFAPVLIESLGLSPPDLSFATAMCFLSVDAAQILREILDRVVLRHASALSLPSASLCKYIYDKAHDLQSVMAGQWLIETEVCGCLAGTFKAT